MAFLSKIALLLTEVGKNIRARRPKVTAGIPGYAQRHKVTKAAHDIGPARTSSPGQKGFHTRDSRLARQLREPGSPGRSLVAGVAIFGNRPKRAEFMGFLNSISKIRGMEKAGGFACAPLTHTSTTRGLKRCSLALRNQGGRTQQIQDGLCAVWRPNVRGVVFTFEQTDECKQSRSPPMRRATLGRSMRGGEAVSDCRSICGLLCAMLKV